MNFEHLYSDLRKIYEHYAPPMIWNSEPSRNISMCISLQPLKNIKEVQILGHINLSCLD
jgi:hypothetical protein